MAQRTSMAACASRLLGRVTCAQRAPLRFRLLSSKGPFDRNGDRDPRPSRKTWDNTENSNEAPVTSTIRGIPERFMDAKTRRPEGLLRATASKFDEDIWMTPEVVESFERNVLLKDLQLPHKKTGEPVEYEYLGRRRRQDQTIEPEEYDFMNHEFAREKPHEIYARLDKGRSNRPRCDKRRRYHIIPQDQITLANLPLLREFLSENGTILKRTVTRLCARCQRKVRNTIKRARNLGFIPHDAGFDVVNLIGFPDKEHKARISKSI